LWQFEKTARNRLRTAQNPAREIYPKNFSPEILKTPSFSVNICYNGLVIALDSGKGGICMLENAVLLMDASPAPPLLLAPAGGRPVLSWMAERLWSQGVRRFFIACEPPYEAQVRSLLAPLEGAEAVVSDRHDALMAFLEGAGMTAVLPRPAFPMAQAGPGFAYAAPGRVLREAWDQGLTNAVGEAELLSGWLPLYGPETLREVEDLLQNQACAPHRGKT